MLSSKLDSGNLGSTVHRHLFSKQIITNILTRSNTHRIVCVFNELISKSFFASDHSQQRF